MKKLHLCLLVTVIIFCLTSPCLASETEGKSPDINDSAKLNDIVMTLLMPELVSAVNTFYSQYLSQNPTIMTYYGCHITDIKEKYTIAVEVLPFIGAHNPVGKDRITLHFNMSGIATVEKYEHLESYELPPHKQSIIIKPLP